VPAATFEPLTVPTVTLLSTRSRACVAVREGVVASARMMAPATKGDAMLVPLFFPVRPPGSVDFIDAPGAYTLVHDPQLENEAEVSESPMG